ncbi:MAG: hypothetical protein ABIH38_04635 [Patescibacteria group bacterium]
MVYVLIIKFRDKILITEEIGEEEADNLARGFGLSWPATSSTTGGGPLGITLTEKSPRKKA